VIYIIALIVLLVFCGFLLTGGDPKNTVYNRLRDEGKER